MRRPMTLLSKLAIHELIASLSFFANRCCPAAAAATAVFVKSLNVEMTVLKLQSFV